MGEIVKAQIDKLSNENYFDWQRRMQAAIKYKKWWLKHLGAEVTKPVQKAGEDEQDFADRLESWTEEDEQVLAMIKMALDIFHLALVDPCVTAKEAWDKLSSYYAPKGLQAQMSLLTELLTGFMGPGERIASWVGRMQNLRERMIMAGGADILHSSLYILKLLQGLPDDWSSTVQILAGKAPADLTETVVLGALTAEENRRMGKSGGALDGALWTNPRPKQQGPSSKPAPPKKFEGVCFNCDIKGHMARDCRKPKKNKGKQAEGANLTQAKKKQQQKKKQLKKQESAQMATTPPEVEDTPPAALMMQAKHEQQMVTLSQVPINASNKQLELVWYVDSGASRHLTTRKDWLHSYQQVQPITVATAEPGRSVKAVGTGSIHLVLPHSDGRQVSVELKSVLFVPRLGKNLFSVDQACKNGAEVVLTGAGGTIFHKGAKLRYPLVRVPGMYCLVGQVVLPPVAQAEMPKTVHALQANPLSSVEEDSSTVEVNGGTTASAVSGKGKQKEEPIVVSRHTTFRNQAAELKKLAAATKWHDRLGHVNKVDLKKMAN